MRVLHFERVNLLLDVWEFDTTVGFIALLPHDTEGEDESVIVSISQKYVQGFSACKFHSEEQDVVGTAIFNSILTRQKFLQSQSCSPPACQL